VERYRPAPSGQRRSGRPGRDERGAALIEFAIVVSILLLIVFGIIEFGLAFNDYLNVRNGSREAARLGVVNDLDNAPACKINGSSVSPPAIPANTSEGTNALICKAKDRIGLDGTKTKIKIAITGEAVGENLKVCAKFPVEAITGFLGPLFEGKTLVSSVTMRLEQVPKFGNFTESGATC
jgi:hypothetical protein